MVWISSQAFFSYSLKNLRPKSSRSCTSLTGFQLFAKSTHLSLVIAYRFVLSLLFPIAREQFGRCSRYQVDARRTRGEHRKEDARGCGESAEDARGCERACAPLRHHGSVSTILGALPRPRGHAQALPLPCGCGDASPATASPSPQLPVGPRQEEELL